MDSNFQKCLAFSSPVVRFLIDSSSLAIIVVSHDNIASGMYIYVNYTKVRLSCMHGFLHVLLAWQIQRDCGMRTET